jgi:hypothetical protein
MHTYVTDSPNLSPRCACHMHTYVTDWLARRGLDGLAGAVPAHGSHQLRRQAVHDHRVLCVGRDYSDSRAVCIDDWRTRHAADEQLFGLDRQAVAPAQHTSLTPVTLEREHARGTFAGCRVLDLKWTYQLGALRWRIGNRQRRNAAHQLVVRVGLIGQALIVGLAEHGMRYGTFRTIE